jgi:DNA-binding CsgD family transcriptional regulator
VKVTLSPHEQKVHDLLLTNRSSKEIAEIVGKTRRLIGRTASTVYFKLGCDSRIDLMAARIFRLEAQVAAMEKKVRGAL